MYAAKILADSLPADPPKTGECRLISLEVTFPRFILAEVNTHRVFSRNSASSRAIPPERVIEEVEAHPFVPEVFRRRVKGMGQGELVADQEAARQEWLAAAADAVRRAKGLIEHDVSKAHVNRVLENYKWQTAIISATDWNNFFALRAPEGDEVDYEFAAQPEFQRLAIFMRTVMRASSPMRIAKGEWALPLVTYLDRDEADKGARQEPTWNGKRWLCMVSAGRCARVSFDKQGELEDAEKSRSRSDGLIENGHLSPLEHQATPDPDGRGNFNGWRQFRATIDHEADHAGIIGRARWDA